MRDWEGEFPSLPAPPPGEAPFRRAIPVGPSTEPIPAADGSSATPQGRESGPEPEPEAAPRPPEPPEDARPGAERTGPAASTDLRSETTPPSGELYSESFLEAEAEDDPFDLPGTEKLGIVGGKGVGKSFLFQALVYRTYSKAQAGAVGLYLDKTRLFYALQRKDKAQSLSLTEFGKKYRFWERLPQTKLTTQQWYRLRLSYGTGIWGKRPAAMDIEFFDGAGENFFEASRKQAGVRQLWREGYLDARVMVFCLPLWAAFPGKMTPEDWQAREDLIGGFESVLRNYEDLRVEGKRTQPVRSILAFTMADDPRNALVKLYDKWIVPYMDSPAQYLSRLQSESGVARYLANARRVSEALHRELLATRDPRVSSIRQKLDFGGGLPWLILLSAIEGKRLDQIEQKYQDPKERIGLPEPVPVHVELPLLVALCERHNALM